MRINRWFKIKKGNHYCLHLPRLYFGRKKDFDIVFKLSDSSYNFTNVDKYDVNKLFGVSFGYHKKNSIRIGWAMYDGALHTFLYLYENKKRVIIDWYKSIFMYATHGITLHFDFAKNKIIVDGEKEFDYQFPKTKWGYYLFPFFGGNNKAPKDIKIYLDVIAK